MSEYRVDEAFGPVPLWLLRTKVSDRAVRLYALLAAMRDYGTDMATVGRKRLARELGCSDDSLDRAKAELEKADAISVQRGEAAGGAIPRNIYTIHRTSPATRTGAATPIPAGVRVADTRTDAAMYEKDLSSRTSSSAKRQGRAPSQVSGKRVTAEEEQFALDVLAAFNEISGRKFGSKEALGKIVLRHREHPELSVAEHRSVIEQQFEKPWWKGDPSVSVVYGNGDVFDRALNGVRGVGNNVSDEQDDPYARGAIRAGD